MNLNIQMFASKKLLTKYLEYYIDSITEIQDERKEQSNKLVYIPFTTGKYSGFYEFVVAHYVISCGMDWRKAYEEFGDFEIIEQKLNECLYSEPFTEEELNHIYIYGRYENEPYLDIAMKRFLFSMYNTSDVEEIVKMFEKEKTWENFERVSVPYKYLINILNKKFEDKEDITRYIYRKYEKDINDRYNCGGYALELFEWVSVESSNHDVMVTKLLANPSVRLLGETLLLDDEYLVVLDAANYHFIKCKDGKFTEKMRISSGL